MINRMAKYADDATLLVPEKTDVQMQDEFNSVVGPRKDRFSDARRVQ